MGVYKNLKTGKLELIITREDVVRYVNSFRESESCKRCLAEIEKMREDYKQSLLKAAERGGK